MSLKKKKILHIDITIESKEKILEYIRKYLVNGSKYTIQSSKVSKKTLVIATPNSEQIVASVRDKYFAKLLNQADIAIPDGIGIVWASRILRQTPLSGRISGIDLMNDLVVMASKERVPMGLIGGRGGVAVRALECLQEKHPGLIGWAVDGPKVNIKYQISNIKYSNQKSKRIHSQQYNNIAIESSFAQAASFAEVATEAESEGKPASPADRQSRQDVTDEYIREVVERIRNTGTRIVFVGLGAPKQEYFIERLRDAVVRWSSSHPAIQPVVFMSVGGAFDVLSGAIPRAPEPIRLLGFEWLWRLLRQPWRVSRQLALPRFILLVLKSRYLHP